MNLATALMSHSKLAGIVNDESQAPRKRRKAQPFKNSKLERASSSPTNETKKKKRHGVMHIQGLST